MGVRQMIMQLVEEGATRKTAFKYFRQQGFSYKATVIMFESHGVTFPDPIIYGDLDPSPDRRDQLVALSIS